MSLLRTAAVASLALAACLAPPARAQVKPATDPDTGVHRMEIWNGPVRSVTYFSRGASQGEQAALRDLERAENGLAVADQIAALRALYLRNERVLEQRRGQVNPLLYGYSSEYATGLFPGSAGTAYAGGFGYPSYGNYYAGTFGFPAVSASLGSATNSLAFGVGNEGVLKNELARGLGDINASPDAIARAGRAYDAAVARVAASDRLRTGLGWGKGDVVAVGHERTVGGPISVTTKDGKTYDGTLVSDDADWVTVETAKEEVTLRKSDVTRIVRPKREVKPEK
jgi:hypothetical protein